MREQEAHRLAVVRTSAGLCKSGADVDRLDLIALLLLVFVRNSVGHNNTAQAAVVDVLSSLAGKDTVDDNSVDFLSTVLHHSIGGLDESTAGISHVVNDDSDLVLNATNENHARDLVGAGALLVDERELEIEAVGDGSGTIQNCPLISTCNISSTQKNQIHLPLSTTSIRTDNDTVAHIQVFADPLQNARLSIQVIDGNVEEALDLAGVEVHGDDVVATSSLEHVCHKLGGDRSTALILLVLARIREVGNDGGDTSCGSGLASIDHDEQLHQSIVDIIGPRRLQDENCRVHTLTRDLLRA